MFGAFVIHICYVETGYPHWHGGGGGAGTYVQLIGRELVRRGHRVSVITNPCVQCPPYTSDEGVDVYRPLLHHSLHWYASKIPYIRIGALTLRYLEHGWSVAQFLEWLNERQPINLVEYTEGGDFWHGLRAPFPYVVHLHGARYTFLRMSGKPLHRGEWLCRRLELAFIRHACCIFSPSQAMLDIVNDELGLPAKESVVLPLPLDPELCVYQEQQGSMKQSNNLCPIILFAARNDPVKGADTLLRAAPLVRQFIPNAEFELYGYTPETGRQVPEGVHCYPFVAKKELLANFHRADVCVVPSLWDNSPNTVYEAMSAGRVVVASRVGGIPELIVDGETGILIDPGNHYQLAQAIVQLLRNDKLRIAMGQKARERIRCLAGLEDNVSMRVEIYEHIITDCSVNGLCSHQANRAR